MSRLARLVIPGLPNHVTQRGNRRARTFFEDDDYALYEALLHESADKAGAEVWCYCLMPTGRPLGSDEWLDDLELATGRQLKVQKCGPKSRGAGDS